MCMGGGSMSAAPTYRPPTPKVIQPGPATAQDQVNKQDVTNINDRSLEEETRQANQGGTATGQSWRQSNKAY